MPKYMLGFMDEFCTMAEFMECTLPYKRSINLPAKIEKMHMSGVKKWLRSCADVSN